MLRGVCHVFIYFGYRSRQIGDPNDPTNRVFFGVLTGVTVLGLLALYQGNQREITWKDFASNYLSKGVVSGLT